MQTRKPWYRPRNVFGAIALVLVAAVTYMIVWAYTAKANPTVDYWEYMAEASLANQPRGGNGWADLMDALDVLIDVRLEMGDGFTFDAIYREPGPYEEPMDPAEALVALDALREAGVLERLASAGQADYFLRPLPPVEDRGPLLTRMLPDLAQMRDLAKALRAEMHLAAQAGDDARVVMALDGMLILARASAAQPAIIEHLVGLAIAAVALDGVRETVEAGCSIDLKRALLATLQRRLPLPTVAINLEGERAALLDTIQRTHTDNGRGNGKLILTSMHDLSGQVGMGGGMNPRPPIINVAGLFFADRATIEAMTNEHFDRMIEAVEGEPVPRDLFDDLDEIMLDWRFMMLKMLLPALGKAVFNEFNYRCRFNGTLIWIAVEGFRDEHGRLPEDLDELVTAGWLDEIPADPFSKDGFVYKVIDDGYLLYTIGLDGVDDGGQQHGSEPLNALRYSNPVLDYVFNPQPTQAEP